MKCNKSESKLFKEILKKHKLTNEGFLMNLFKKALKNKLDKDGSLHQSLIDADASLVRLKQNVDALEKKGYNIPAELKKYIR